MDRRPPPLSVDILSDDDDGAANSPSPPRRRKRLAYGGGYGGGPPPTVLVIDDDPTPKKSNPERTPSFVAETPLSSDHIFYSDASLVKCTLSRSNPGSSSPPLPEKFSGVTGLIYLESDNELEGDFHSGRRKTLGTVTAEYGLAERSEMYSSFSPPECPMGTTDFIKIAGDSLPHGDLLSEDAVPQLRSIDNVTHGTLRQADSPAKQKSNSVAVDADKSKHKNEEAASKKQLKEEKVRLNEERKRKRLQEKLNKEALKAEAAEMKKLEKEKQKWEKGKFAVKSIVAEIDAKVIENGSVGGHLLTRFAEKGLSYRITSNPVERSILWKMIVPDQIAQVSSGGVEVPYVLLVYQAEEFCNTVASESLIDHIHTVRGHYPSFTLCYLTNKLMSYINKCEQKQYKNPSSVSCWRRPQIEEALSKLATHFTKVHSRQCIDEAELAEHVVGLTCSLANCQFRKKSTWLSVNANGSIIPKGFIDKNLIKKSIWLKALIAIPKVQPRCAIAISKRYPTMRSLLNVYMDPNKSVHEKEFLLKDLMIEGLLGNEDRRLGEACSKRVYRILMAQRGGVNTDEVEDGADFFGG